MSARRYSWVVIAMLVCGIASDVVQAHVMNTGQVTLNIVGERVYVAATLPLKAFPTADTEEIAARVTRALQVSTRRHATSLQGVIVTIDDAGHAASEAHAVLVLGVAIFDATPVPLQLSIAPEFLAKTGKLVAIASYNVDGRPREFGRRTLTATKNSANFSFASRPRTDCQNVPGAGSMPIDGTLAYGVAMKKSNHIES